MHQRESLSSRMGFILLSAGCAIGLGNVWRFPFITGKYGGATFVLIYLLFLAIFGLPIMVMEFAIGRASRKTMGEAYKLLEPAKTKWHLIGPVSIANSYLLMMYYTTITGWLLSYFWQYLTGGMAHLASEKVADHFSQMLSHPLSMALWMALAIIMGFAIGSGGLQKGVESITKKMMIGLLFLIVILAVHSIMLPGGKEGLSFYLKPTLEPIRENGLFDVVFAAMSQAFFTLSIGMGSMTIFGSYIDKDHSLTGESIHVIVLDTLVALISGLIIFPACSAYGVQVNAGPSLLFISMPHIFSRMAGGRFWGTLFFLFMSFAAMSTVITVLENITSYWIDHKGMKRSHVCLVNAIVLILLSLPCVLGFNVLAGFQPLGVGTGVLDLEDFIVSSTLLPLGSLLLCIFCTRRIGWGWKAFVEEADAGKGLKFPAWARLWVTWGIPILFIIVFVKGYIDILAH